MNKIYLYFLLLLLGSAGVALRFSASHEKMPIGCDEFGYLNLAKAITEGKTFQNHTERPYLVPLLDTLRKAGITENEISWMVTPHAYHVLPNTNKIINQYPPGTSLLLAALPLKWRQVLFPLIIIFLLVGMVMIYKKLSPGFHFTLFDLLFPLFIYVMMVSAPFTTELSRINSLAPTFGLLFAAGLFLNNRVFLSVFLIALTINFRVVNALMLVPVLLFLPFQNFSGKTNLKTNIILLVNFGLLVAFATLPVLIYNFLLTGNPFAITYSSIDQRVVPLNNIFKNISFYFSPGQRWLGVHLMAAIVLMILLITDKLKLKTLLKLSAFAVLNYGFFVIHDMSMDYYPYASAMILTGFTFGEFNKIQVPLKSENIFKAVFVAVTLLIFGVGLGSYLKKDHINYEVARQKYNSLCNYNIVWADLYSGTSEYVCKNSGFRYGTTTPRARKMAIEYLHKNNYRQAILLDDNTVEEHTVIGEINDLKISFHIIKDESIGKILVID